MKPTERNRGGAAKGPPRGKKNSLNKKREKIYDIFQRATERDQNGCRLCRARVLSRVPEEKKNVPWLRRKGQSGGKLMA